MKHSKQTISEHGSLQLLDQADLSRKHPTSGAQTTSSKGKSCIRPELSPLVVFRRTSGHWLASGLLPAVASQPQLNLAFISASILKSLALHDFAILFTFLENFRRLLVPKIVSHTTTLSVSRGNHLVGYVASQRSSSTSSRCSYLSLASCAEDALILSQDYLP